MIIGIDARAYGWSGLGRYTRNLLRHLSHLRNGPDIVAFVPRAFAREVAELPRVQAIPVNGSYYSFQEQTVFLASLLRTRIDLMHFLHFNAPVFYRRPSVVTVHDLTRFLFPAQKHTGAFHQWAYEEVFRAAVLNAERVITVSEHTRNDLLRFFPFAASRTMVIPEGIEHDRYVHTADSATDEIHLSQLGITKPYLLFVGVWMNHKNLPRLLEAFHRVRSQGYRGSLVITGRGRAHDEDVPGIVRRLGLSDVVKLPGVVNEDLLPSVYRQADAFVFPSLYEGFGFPPLEAMACGTPVVASAVASLPEILGDAAVYVDPLSPDDIARGILQVLHHRECTEELIVRGIARVSAYQWERCARATAQLYASVAVPARAHTISYPT